MPPTGSSTLFSANTAKQQKCHHYLFLRNQQVKGNDTYTSAEKVSSSKPPAGNRCHQRPDKSRKLSCLLVNIESISTNQLQALRMFLQWSCVYTLLHCHRTLLNMHTTYFLIFIYFFQEVYAIAFCPRQNNLIVYDGVLFTLLKPNDFYKKRQSQLN